MRKIITISLFSLFFVSSSYGRFSLLEKGILVGSAAGGGVAISKTLSYNKKIALLNKIHQELGEDFSLDDLENIAFSDEEFSLANKILHSKETVDQLKNKRKWALGAIVVNVLLCGGIIAKNIFWEEHPNIVISNPKKFTQGLSIEEFAKLKTLTEQEQIRIQNLSIEEQKDILSKINPE